MGVTLSFKVVQVFFVGLNSTGKIWDLICLLKCVSVFHFDIKEIEKYFGETLDEYDLKGHILRHQHKILATSIQKPILAEL